ncbi:sporulation protein YunB [uncultured Clostridium sp.]|uniref:sporulation protein YunB n=1 Tax=uncultured Clostridium sp. TaxID=59620 RepID=UPI0028E7FEF5|nr:sporulation protein YunB [uncultured Clostridium sp.]
MLLDEFYRGVNKIKRGRYKYIIFFVLSFTIILLTVFIYVFDSIVTPIVLNVADREMKAKVIDTINRTTIDVCMDNFEYEDIINIEKDNDGNISIIKANTLKMNKIACDVAIESQNKLKEMSMIGVKIPSGFVFKNNLLSYFGPSFTIKVRPVGYIETKYSSDFESAGINQTRHKIYIHVKSNLRIITPMKSRDIEVNNEIAIAETIIVGKVPETAIDFGLNNAGFKLKTTEGN